MGLANDLMTAPLAMGTGAPVSCIGRVGAPHGVLSEIACFRQLTVDLLYNLRLMTLDPQAFRRNPPATKEALQSLIAALPKSLPDDYIAFLERSNGGEGFVGERYVSLWKAEELITRNSGYKVTEFFPNFFFIGSDGGGEAYAFDISGHDVTVFEVPFIGMPSDASAIADSFDALLLPQIS